MLADAGMAFFLLGGNFHEYRRLPPKKEAPPGFEPGVADLQSAALPLG